MSARNWERTQDVIAFLFCLLMISEVKAQSLWSHNGSEVLLEANGNIRRFVYLNPRKGLPAKSGDVLFEGARQGSTYRGDAYLFSEKCGKISYAVTGYVGSGDRLVEMRGMAPRRNASCIIVSYFEDVLVFNFKSTQNSNQGAPAFPSGQVGTGLNRAKLLDQNEILSRARNILSDQEIIDIEFIQRERECNFDGTYSMMPAYKIISMYRKIINAHVFDARTGDLLCAKDAN